MEDIDTGMVTETCRLGPVSEGFNDDDVIDNLRSLFYECNTCDGEKFTTELRKSSYLGQNRNGNSNDDDVIVIDNDV